MQPAPNPKSTPNRRRHTPGRNRNTSQKVHASDNDVPSYKLSNAESPSTPRRLVSTGSIAAPQPESTGPKQRSKSNKTRNAKNGATPAGRRQQAVDSPSVVAQDGLAIFAGSTFHASPAPSDLPLPSFLGRSNGESPLARAKHSSIEGEEYPPTTDSDDSSHGDESAPCDEESPLEFFFRADRAEKARVRRASSANTKPVMGTPSCPQPESHAKECNTFPKAIPHASHRQPVFVHPNVSPGVYSTGPNSGSRLPLGPAFSTPYQDRIRAARSSQTTAQAPTPMASQRSDSSSTEALKSFLFNGQLSQPASQASGPSPSIPSQPKGPSHVPHFTHQAAQQQQRSPGTFSQQAPNPGSQPPPFATPSNGPGALPASPSTGHGHHHRPTNSSVHTRAKSDDASKQIDAMEGDLRRILKLDSPR